MASAKTVDPRDNARTSTALSCVLALAGRWACQVKSDGRHSCGRYAGAIWRIRSPAGLYYSTSVVYFIAMYAGSGGNARMILSVRGTDLRAVGVTHRRDPGRGCCCMGRGLGEAAVERRGGGDGLVALGVIAFR